MKSPVGVVPPVLVPKETVTKVISFDTPVGPLALVLNKNPIQTHFSKYRDKRRKAFIRLVK